MKNKSLYILSIIALFIGIFSLYELIIKLGAFNNFDELISFNLVFENILSCKEFNLCEIFETN